jgi:peptidyl-prolyl cis-trans isomerase D
MLQFIRERSKGVFAWIVIVLIIIPFALWGIDQFRNGDKIEVAAKVNGEPVLAADVARAFDNVKRQYQENLGEMYASLVQEDKLRTQVMDDLIQRTAIDQDMKHEGFAINDQLLAQAIQSQKMFQDKGVFSVSRYEEVLRNNNYSKERFEASQRQFMMRNQLESLITSGEIIGQTELNALAALESQERDIGYLRVDYRPYLASAHVDEAQVNSYYEQNKDRFKAPEQVAVEYIHLSAADLMKSIKVTDDQVLAYYKEHLDKVQLPEKRNVRHILIMAAKDADAKVDAAAKAKIEGLVDQISKGADFADLAKKNSEDPGSATRGGELGFFQRGDMVPEFEQAAFALKNVGDLSPIVRTSYGYHVLQLVAVEPAKTPAFEQVRDIMTSELKTDLAMKAYTTQLETLKTLTFEQDDSLAPAAKKLDLPVQTSQLMTKETGEGVFAEKSVIDAAFSNKVLKDKLNSAVVETQAGEAVVMHLKDYIPEHDKSLAEVHEDIVQQLKKQAAVAQAKAQADALLSDVKKPAADPAMLVKTGITWQSSEWLGRSADKVLPEVLSAAFKAPKPKDTTPVWVEKQLSTGDTVLIRVAGVRTDDAKVKQIADELKQAAMQVFSDATVEALGNAVKDKAKVEILVK